MCCKIDIAIAPSHTNSSTCLRGIHATSEFPFSHVHFLALIVQSQGMIKNDMQK